MLKLSKFKDPHEHCICFKIPLSEDRILNSNNPQFKIGDIVKGYLSYSQILVLFLVESDEFEQCDFKLFTVSILNVAYIDENNVLTVRHPNKPYNIGKDDLIKAYDSYQDHIKNSPNLKNFEI
jgi:hypothetical protein